MSGRDAAAVAGAVLNPELPVLTLAELGVLRGVEQDGDAVVVTLTPTYSGCPALAEMRTDLHAALTAAGFGPVQVRTVLSPAWSTDWITAEGRRKLAGAGIAPPGPAPRRGPGPIPLTLTAPAPVTCPRCAARDTEELSRFGPTACTALWRCRSCREPFEHVKEL